MQLFMAMMLIVLIAYQEQQNEQIIAAIKDNGCNTHLQPHIKRTK